MSKKIKGLFERFKPNLEKSLNKWMRENEYKEVELTEEIVADLLDELFCFLVYPSDLSYIMDEVDKDGMLGEYDWCERIKE